MLALIIYISIISLKENLSPVDSREKLATYSLQVTSMPATAVSKTIAVLSIEGYRYHKLRKHFLNSTTDTQK